MSGVDGTNVAAHGVCGTACGALRNAFKHACAIRIEAEIAWRLDSNLVILSEVESGTKAELKIPARTAYEEGRGKGRFRFGRLWGKARERAGESR
jgi:hypothetical protein